MPKIGSTSPEQDIYVDQVCGHFQVQAILDLKGKNCRFRHIVLAFSEYRNFNRKTPISY